MQSLVIFHDATINLIMLHTRKKHRHGGASSRHRYPWALSSASFDAQLKTKRFKLRWYLGSDFLIFSRGRIVHVQSKILTVDQHLAVIQKFRAGFISLNAFTTFTLSEVTSGVSQCMLEMVPCLLPEGWLLASFLRATFCWHLGVICRAAKGSAAYVVSCLHHRQPIVRWMSESRTISHSDVFFLILARVTTNLHPCFPRHGWLKL